MKDDSSSNSSESSFTPIDAVTDKPPAVGIAASTYARSAGELMGLMNELRASGASLVMDLPRICVIGNQSAGKSSLIEAISGIRVPRDSGTCTRCPSEVRLRNSTTAWACKISLRFETDQNGVANKSGSEVPFGPVLVDSILVEKTLRKAQLAILNPTITDLSRFQDLSDKELLDIQKGGPMPGSAGIKALSFSTNIIVIDISGPNVTDLTFYDLPGLIANSGDGNDSDVDLIRNLVVNKITGNCIILLAISMRDDFENQSAGRMAREADPKGSRTIGVLTKADTVQDGEHDRWLDVLQGRRHHLQQGYFCTKQPLKLDLSFEESRAEESAFFKRTDPWKSVGADIQQRYGTDNLTSFLSNRLSQYISDTLPDLMQKTSRASIDVNSALANLPAAPSSDPVSELQQLLFAFSSELACYSEGTAGCEKLTQDALKLFQEFKLDIKATEPTFVCQTKKELVAITNVLPEQKQKIERLEPILGNQVHSLLVLEDVLDVKQRILNARTRELPMNTPYATKRTLMLASVAAWSALTDHFVDNLRPLVFNVIEGLISKHFGRFDAGPLRNCAGQAIRAEVEALFMTASKQAQWLISLEANIFTLNDHYFSSSRDNCIVEFKKKRQPHATNELLDDPDNKAALAHALTSMGISNDPTKLAALLPDDIYHEEIEVMAQVLAFWKVAYKRLVDHVVLAVDFEIIRKLAKATLMPLQTAVGMTGNDSAANARVMLAENRDVVAQREDLIKRKNRLDAARKALSSFGLQSTSK